jgi:iron complex outermembrane receptor protein
MKRGSNRKLFSNAGNAGSRRIKTRALAMLAALEFAQISGAQTVAPDAGAARQLPAVVVTGDAVAETGTGPVAGYVAHRSEAGTKTDTPIVKVPQAISVVTRDQMDVQNVQSVAQALRYTSGINPEQRGTNTDSLEYLYARGFLVDEFWNGLRTPGPAGGYGFNVTSFDPYMFERIELLHGPASVLYGQGSPGGTVELVSKMPTDTPLHEVGFTTGSYGRTQGYFDFSGPVDRDGKLLYRLTADGVNTGTQTDYVNQQRFAIAPSLTWRPSANTSLTVFANYQADPQAGIYNSVPYNYPSRSLYPGEPTFDSFRKTQESIGYRFEHRLNDTWSFKQNYRYLHNSQTIQYVGNDGYGADGVTLSRTPYLNTGMVNAHTLDNQLSARFGTGPLKHNATFGVDYQNIQFDHYFYGSTSATPGLNVGNPVYGQSIPYPTFMYATSVAQSINQLGAYAQDQIDVGKWSFLLGARQDWANEDQTSYKTGAGTTQNDRAFTWRAGAVYRFDNGVAPYASYSRSFQPQVGTTYGGQAFAPLTGEQYEVGVKLQPKGYNSFVTVSAFNLTENNVATTDPLHSGFSVLTGQVRSRGFEVEGHASLTDNLQLIGSYTYTNLLNTRSNTSNRNKVPVGIPSNTASLWADYTISSGPLAGLLIGGGVRYVGSSYADTANTFKIPSATLLDLSLRYDLGRRFPDLKGLTVSLTATNLSNRKYIASCSSSMSYCYWGQGRLILAGAKYQW